MIDVTCRCGKLLRAKDEAAGKSAKCPKCGESIEIPIPPRVSNQANRMDLGIDLAAQLPAEPPSRPFWKDPVFIVGATVPAVVLLAFFVYLAIQRTGRVHREQIIAINTNANSDRLAGKIKAAYDKYGQAISLFKPKDLTDETVRAAIEEAKAHRLKLEPIVTAQLEREQKERERLQAEAKEKAEEAERVQAAFARDKEEAERYAKVSADVTGGAWIVNKLGKSDIIRGLNVYLINLKMPRDELSRPIEAFEFITREQAKKTQDSHSAAFTRLADHFAEMGRQPSTDKIDMAYFYTLARQAAIGDESTRSNNGKFRAITQDDLWTVLVPKVSAAKAISNIDGKYQFENVPGGRYFIYSLYATEHALVEWVVPLEVATTSPIAKDLFNDNAVLILNKDGD